MVTKRVKRLQYELMSTLLYRGLHTNIYRYAYEPVSIHTYIFSTLSVKRAYKKLLHSAVIPVKYPSIKDFVSNISNKKETGFLG